MKLATLLRRNLRFHRRGNFAVFLGVAVGTAVLTGALLVGDSLQGSLRDLTERRVGWVDQAMVTGRFFREDLGDKVGNQRLMAMYDHLDELSRQDRFTLPVAAMVLQGSAQTSSDGITRRAGRVTVWGVNDDFWRTAEMPRDRSYLKQLIDSRKPMEPFSSFRSWGSFWSKNEPVVVLSAPLAAELGVKPGDSVTVNVRKASAVPRETLLGRRDAAEVLEPLRLKVHSILPPNDFGSQFTLNPTPAPPRNAFVPLRFLQDKLDLKDKANAILVGGPSYGLPDQLAKSLTLADWGLVLHDPEERAASLFAKLDRNKDGKLTRSEWKGRIAGVLAKEADAKGVLTREAVIAYYQKRGYLSLESKQMLLEPAVVDAALKAAKECNLQAAPTLVYLANGIRHGSRPDEQEIPYSVVAALDPNLPPPLGPFLPLGDRHLKDNEIILADWTERPLGFDRKQGLASGAIMLSYFKPEHGGRLEQAVELFSLDGFISLQGVADDPDLTPEFPGITDKLTLKDWNPPFPYDNKRVKKRDEEYWDEYRTTPKAYITLKKGQELWGSRFGDVTSIRLAPAAGQDLTAAAKEFTARLQANLDPKQGGFVFDDVRARGLQASAGGTDFSGLFLAFSFFLIAAALLLVGLMFRLNIDRRASEVGLLLAAGYRRRTVRRLLLTEGALIAALGGLLGCVIAVGYAWGLLELLRRWWPGTLDRSFLRLHISAPSLVIGYFASLAVSLLTIAWAVRILGKTPPSALLAGQTTVPEVGKAEPERGWGGLVALVSGLLGIGLVSVGNLVPEGEIRASTFFSGGFFLLSAGLALVWYLMRRQHDRFLASSPRLHILSLAFRNAARHPARSLLTAGLLASAAFLIVAVESFRRQPEKDFLEKNGGSGAFALLGESDVPIYQDLNQGPGHDELVEALERAKLPKELYAEARPSDPIRPDPLAQVKFFPFRLRTGDDASCLNLYKPGRPRLLGVPHSLVERGGFRFAGLAEKTENPWSLLEAKDDDAIPVFGEANTVQWMLHSKLGGIVDVPDERGQLVKLKIVGLLQDSVFQSELLMSEANFLRLYPRQEGYNFFLIDAPPDKADAVKGLLDTALAERGFEATSTAGRLASYLAVENTYLSTFQALGGLGLMLGALGLAVVLLRSVWERRGELALLRALGFRRGVLGRLVFAENGFLLAAGLGIGTVAAVLAVLPHVLAGGGDVPWLHIALFLALVVLIGLAAGGWAMRATLRAPLLPALRKE